MIHPKYHAKQSARAVPEAKPRTQCTDVEAPSCPSTMKAGALALPGIAGRGSVTRPPCSSAQHSQGGAMRRLIHTKASARTRPRGGSAACSEITYALPRAYTRALL